MTLEMEFHNEMLQIYEKAKKYGYKPTRFLQMVRRRGGLEAAKRLIMKPGGTSGFHRLKLLGHMDISVEALILNPKYQSLFTIGELQICKERLLQYGVTITD